MTIHQQSVFERWNIDDESVNSIITSPPYYALRKYAIPDVIIGGNKECKHEWGKEFKAKQSGGGWANPDYIGGQKKDWDLGEVSQGNFCVLCNAWKGQHGLEPTPYGNEHSYVEHTRLWAKEAWRVLKKDGIFFLNLADSYPSGGGKAVEQSYKRQSAIDTGAYPDYSPSAKLRQSIPKCQLLIPHRVAIALIDDGWVLRNTICWFKSNAMPESVTDRFSKKYEYIFMFTKSPKYYLDLDAVREKCSSVNKLRNKNSELSNNGYIGDRFSKGERPEQHPLGKNPGDVWQVPTQPSGLSHYAMWPEKLVERMIKCSTKAGDTVLDCFCGSATTLKVAEELQRIGIGIDLGYQDISKKRTANIQKKMFV